MSDSTAAKRAPPKKPAPYKPAPYSGSRKASNTVHRTSIAATGFKVDLSDVKASSTPPSKMKKPFRPPSPGAMLSGKHEKEPPKIRSYNGVPIHRFMTSMIVHSPYVPKPPRKPVRPPPPKFREKKPWETPTHRFITSMVVHSPWTPLPKKPTAQDKAMKGLHTATKKSKAGIAVASASVAKQSTIIANKSMTKSKSVYAKTKEKYAARQATAAPVYAGAMLSGGQTDVVMADEHGVWPHMKMTSFLNHAVYVPTSLEKKYQYRPPIDEHRASLMEHPIPAHRFISSFQSHASHVPETLRTHYAYNPLEVTGGRNRSITTADGGHTVRVTEAPKNQHLPVVPDNTDRAKSPQMQAVTDKVKNTWNALRGKPAHLKHKKDKEKHNDSSNSGIDRSESKKSVKSNQSVTKATSRGSFSSASSTEKPATTEKVEQLEVALGEPSTAPDYDGMVSNITSGTGDVPDTSVVHPADTHKTRSGSVSSVSSTEGAAKSADGGTSAGVPATHTDGAAEAAAVAVSAPDANGVKTVQVESVPVVVAETDSTAATTATAESSPATGAAGEDTTTKHEHEHADGEDDKDEKFHDARESFKKKGLFHTLSSFISSKKNKTPKSSKDNTPKHTPGNSKPTTPSGTTPEPAPAAEVPGAHEPDTTPQV